MTKALHKGDEDLCQAVSEAIALKTAFRMLHNDLEEVIQTIEVFL